MGDRAALFAGRAGDKSSTKRSAVSNTRANSPARPPSTLEGHRETKRTPSGGSGGRGSAARGVAASTQRRELQAKEAEDYRKQANKCLQKTMTRWNPDFFSAAPLFEKAGACYRAAGEDNKATSMFMQAGECQSHESVMAHASAAKDFREAALITERQGRKDEAAALYLRCAEMWVHADEAGRAADYLGRSAKLVEDEDERAATDRYINAAKVMVPPGSDTKTNFVRVIGGCEVLVQGIRFLASTNQLDECMQVVERYCIILQAEEIEHSLARMYLTYCILALAKGDYVRAETAFRDEHLQSTAYLHSEECRVEEELLTAVRDYRPDLLEQAQNDRTLRRLETPIVRLAKSLRIAGDDEEVIVASGAPSGTIGDARARLGALKEKYGGADSSSTESPITAPLSSSTSTLPAPPLPTALASTPKQSESASLLGSGTPPLQAGDDDQRRNTLFFGARGRPPGGKRSTVEAVAGASTELDSRGGKDQEANEGDVDLGLSDLEASLRGVGDGEDDDLEALIEAARIEAEAFGLKEKGTERDEESGEEDDDIDLT